jgi:hypothetical protein
MELLDDRKYSGAHVLLFKPGQEDEGVYTLQGRSDARTFMVAFVGMEEALRFAELLQAEGFDLPAPTEWDTSQLTSFCSAAGFLLALVPQGALFLPPKHNVYDSAAYAQLHKRAAEGESEVSTLPDETLTRFRDMLERMFNEE